MLSSRNCPEVFAFETHKINSDENTGKELNCSSSLTVSSFARICTWTINTTGILRKADIHLG